MHSCIEDNYDLFIEYFAFERLSSVQMPRLPCRSFSVRFSIFARSRYNGTRIGEKRLREAREWEREWARKDEWNLQYSNNNNNKHISRSHLRENGCISFVSTLQLFSPSLLFPIVLVFGDDVRVAANRRPCERVWVRHADHGIWLHLLLLIWFR